MLPLRRPPIRSRPSSQRPRAHLRGVRHDDRRLVAGGPVLRRRRPGPRRDVRAAARRPRLRDVGRRQHRRLGHSAGVGAAAPVRHELAGHRDGNRGRAHLHRARAPPGPSSRSSTAAGRRSSDAGLTADCALPGGYTGGSFSRGGRPSSAPSRPPSTTRSPDERQAALPVPLLPAAAGLRLHHEPGGGGGHGRAARRLLARACWPAARRSPSDRSSTRPGRGGSACSRSTTRPRWTACGPATPPSPRGRRPRRCTR